MMWRQYKDMFLYYLILKPQWAFVIDMPKIHIVFDVWSEGGWEDLFTKTEPIKKIDPPQSWTLNDLGKFVVMSIFGEKEFIHE